MSERAVDLIERIATLQRSSHRAAAARAGLSLAQLNALTYLTECNRFSDTPAAVAEFLEATRGTTSQTLKALEDKGLIARHGDSGDRRIQHLCPTPVGRQTVERARTGEVADAVAALGGAADTLEVALETVLRTVQSARGGRAFGQCGTCRYLEGTAGRYVCGLTKEPLADAETTLRCVEHDLVAA